MAQDLGERNREHYARYKDDVEKEGKAFFPFAMLQDTVMGLVAVLVTGMLLGFTGYLLPWDQTAYWATVVGINLNGTAPFAGPWLAQFLSTGPEIGSETLAKWYSLHMLVLPGALFALIGVHLYLVARLGVVSPPWSKEAAGREREAAPPSGAREGLVRGASSGGKS